MTLSPREKELIESYRTASEHDRRRISIITQEAAEGAERISIRRKIGWGENCAKSNEK